MFLESPIPSLFINRKVLDHVSEVAGLPSPGVLQWYRVPDARHVELATLLGMAIEEFNARVVRHCSNEKGIAGVVSWDGIAYIHPKPFKRAVKALLKEAERKVAKGTLE